MKRIDHFHLAGSYDDYLRIEVEDYEYSGRAYANYTYYLKKQEWEQFGQVRFQKGMIDATHQPNGVTESLLLSILVDRLTRFQNDKSTQCKQNEIALTHLEAAAKVLSKKKKEQVEKEFIGLEGVKS